ncbi:MAG: hypothetical protein K6A67_04065 [Bacteroidales bacterium]|nr:hypothetical protein [Bacteroidales bacterium]
MNLLEKIDELRAMSVTPEQFQKTWGYTLEEYLEKMHRFVEEQNALDNTNASAKK